MGKRGNNSFYVKQKPKKIQIRSSLSSSRSDDVWSEISGVADIYFTVTHHRPSFPRECRDPPPVRSGTGFRRAVVG